MTGQEEKCSPQEEEEDCQQTVMQKCQTVEREECSTSGEKDCKGGVSRPVSLVTDYCCVRAGG